AFACRRRKKAPFRGLRGIWRGGGDSNPRGAINACLISSQVHSTALPPPRDAGVARPGAERRGRNDTGRGAGRQGAAGRLTGPFVAGTAPMSEISVPVSFGELLDKIAILQIKSERMSDPAKLANVR